MKKIAQANEKFNTVTCKFTKTVNMVMMEKELASEGNLTYVRPSQLKMEYTNPAGDLLEINGDALTLISGKQKRNSNVKGDGRMATLKNTLLYSVGGDIAGVVAENNASVKFEETPQYSIFTLSKGKGAKSQYVELVLSYSKKDFSLCVMKMVEPNGNYTVYNTPVKEFK
jgi:outer membrane lipoprotein-sorting protein